MTDYFYSRGVSFAGRNPIVFVLLFIDSLALRASAELYSNDDLMTDSHLGASHSDPSPIINPAPVIHI